MKQPSEPSRRDLARLAFGVVVGSELIVAHPSDRCVRNRPAMKHRGMLHTKADLDRIKTKVAAGTEPWKSDWEKFRSDAHAEGAHARHIGQHHQRVERSHAQRSCREPDNSMEQFMNSL